MWDNAHAQELMLGLTHEKGKGGGYNLISHFIIQYFLYELEKKTNAILDWSYFPCQMTRMTKTSDKFLYTQNI